MGKICGHGQSPLLSRLNTGTIILMTRHLYNYTIVRNILTKDYSIVKGGHKKCHVFSAVSFGRDFDKPFPR